MESTIERKLKRSVEVAGGRCWKWVSPGRRGVPDRIVMFMPGIICFVELKDTGKKERADQRHVQFILERYGFKVFSSVDSEEKILEVIEWCVQQQKGGE